MCSFAKDEGIYSIVWLNQEGYLLARHIFGSAKNFLDLSYPVLYDASSSAYIFRYANEKHRLLCGRA